MWANVFTVCVCTGARAEEKDRSGRLPTGNERVRREEIGDLSQSEKEPLEREEEFGKGGILEAGVVEHF